MCDGPWRCVSLCWSMVLAHGVGWMSSSESSSTWPFGLVVRAIVDSPIPCVVVREIALSTVRLEGSLSASQPMSE